MGPRSIMGDGSSSENAWLLAHPPGASDMVLAGLFRAGQVTPSAPWIGLVFPCRCKSLAELKSKRPRPLHVETLASTAAEASGAEPKLAPDPPVAHTQA